MKLNPDCIRDILLEIEKQPFNHQLMFEDLATALNYTKDELAYTCLRLEEGDLINIAAYEADNQIFVEYISNLTYQGHQFLAVVESDTVWNKTKPFLSKLGVSSLSAIMQIATQVLNELIHTLLNI